MPDAMKAARSTCGVVNRRVLPPEILASRVSEGSSIPAQLGLRIPFESPGTTENDGTSPVRGGLGLVSVIR